MSTPDSRADVGCAVPPSVVPHSLLAIEHPVFDVGIEIVNWQSRGFFGHIRLNRKQLGPSYVITVPHPNLKLPEELYPTHEVALIATEERLAALHASGRLFPDETDRSHRSGELTQAAIRFLHDVKLPRFSMKKGERWSFVVWKKMELRLREICTAEFFEFAAGLCPSKYVELVYLGPGDSGLSRAAGWVPVRADDEPLGPVHLTFLGREAAQTYCGELRGQGGRYLHAVHAPVDLPLLRDTLCVRCLETYLLSPAGELSVRQ
jgi:hypothetical protein